MTRPRNPNAGRTCDRCRRPLPERRQPYGLTAQCPGCLAEQRDARRFTRAGERIAYTPLEEILASPVVRILRALRWFDWIEVTELYVVLNAPEDAHCAERLALAQALSRAVRAGQVERLADRSFVATAARPGGRDHNWYRITAAGRAELERRLAVDMEVAEDEPASDERSAAA